MTGAPLLETRGLTMRFGGVTAVAGADFTLGAGELRCLIGPNGAGKSTFFKCLTGQLRPTEGEILFDGASIAGEEPHQIARRGIAIKTQVPSLFDGLSVAENLRLAAARTRGRSDARAAVEEIVRLVGLAERAGSLASQLPHGQRQWLELGLVLACDPRLMLLDEPTAGMTKQEVARTAEIIREIGRDRSMIVVEHDMQFIQMIAGRVTVFHQGLILAEDTMDNILADERVRDVYLGKQAGGARAGGDA
ncbi:MAG: ATP-binding cassette domain-containing protein [Defluviicoccus sp.]|nr:ATP-binding cassette domain-containing protein [Defluviicoccus sp.]